MGYTQNYGRSFVSKRLFDIFNEYYELFGICNELFGMCNEFSKYLGVTIDEHLTWNDLVKTVISKANKVKGFLQRNIKYCPSIVKVRCFNSMIRPILEYASAIWSPYTQKNTD